MRRTIFFNLMALIFAFSWGSYAMAITLTQDYLKECVECEQDRKNLKQCFADKEQYILQIKTLEDQVFNHEAILLRQITAVTTPLNNLIEEMKKENHMLSASLEEKKALLKTQQEQQEKILQDKQKTQNENIVLLDSLQKSRQEIEDLKTRQLEALVQEKTKAYQKQIQELKKSYQDKEASSLKSYQKQEEVHQKTIQKLREELAQKELQLKNR